MSSDRERAIVPETPGNIGIWTNRPGVLGDTGNGKITGNLDVAGSLRVGGVPLVGRAIVSPSPPTNPVVGDLWYDSTIGYLKVWDSSEWSLSSGPLQVLVQPVYDYYVSNTGSDANDGRTAAQPWLTLQHSIEWLYTSLDFNHRTVILHLADGSYDGFVIQGAARGLDIPYNMILRGNTTNPDAVTITGTNEPAIGVGTGAILLLEGMKLTQSGGPIQANIAAWNNAEIMFRYINFAQAGWAHVQVGSGSMVYIVGPYRISAGAAHHYILGGGAQIGTWNDDTDYPPPSTVTVTGNPNFPNGFAVVDDLSVINVTPVLSFTGAATGPRYAAAHLSIIRVNGGGPNFFPGDPGSGSPTSGTMSAVGGLYLP